MDGHNGGHADGRAHATRGTDGSADSGSPGDTATRVDGLETRELRYFVAVAEELHFGRAADRLGIAQPPLSRAIKQMERRLGVLLLERSSRRVALTTAGTVLLDEGRRALEVVSAAGRRAQRAGADRPRLALVLRPGGDGGLLDPILEAYQRESDAIEVDVTFSAAADRAALLCDGRADVALLHRPHEDMTGLDTEDLLVQRQVVVLPRGHRLAGRATVTLADLTGQTLPNWPGMPAYGNGPGTYDAGQLLRQVALGRMVAVLPETVAAQVGGDLVCVPVVDAPTTTVVLAWPEYSRSRAVAALVRAATGVAAQRQHVIGEAAGWS